MRVDRCRLNFSPQRLYAREVRTRAYPLVVQLVEMRQFSSECFIYINAFGTKRVTLQEALERLKGKEGLLTFSFTFTFSFSFSFSIFPR